MKLTNISKAVYDCLLQLDCTVTQESETNIILEIEEEDISIQVDLIMKDNDEVCVRLYHCIGRLTTDLELQYGKSACVHLNPYLLGARLVVVPLNDDCTVILADAMACCNDEEEAVSCIPHLFDAIFEARGMVVPFMAQNLRAARGGCTGPKLYHVK